MSRDLEDAIRALRSMGEAETDPGDDGDTRDRVLGSLERRGRTRRTMTSIAVVMALCLSGTTVWGMASGWIPAVVRTIVGSEPAKVGPAEPAETAAARKKKTRSPKPEGAHASTPAPAPEPEADPAPEPAAPAAAPPPPAPEPEKRDAYASPENDAHAPIPAASAPNSTATAAPSSPRKDAYASLPAASPRPRPVPHASSGAHGSTPVPPVIMGVRPTSVTPAAPAAPPRSEPPPPEPEHEPAATPEPERVPSDPELALFRAAHKAHFSGTSAAKALTAWDAYLHAFPNGALAPEARWNRALALVRLGRKDDALAALAPFAAAAPGSYRRAEAQKLIEALGKR